MYNFSEKSRELFQSVLSQDDKWSPYRQMTANVFNAYSSRALRLDQIEGVARIVEGLPADASLEDAVRFFVRAKVLRSRRDNGGRLYEVNFLERGEY